MHSFLSFGISTLAGLKAAEQKLVPMKMVNRLNIMRLPVAIALVAFFLAISRASAATVNAVWNSATDVPITANGYTATGNTVNFTLNCAPVTGSDLMVVSNTALGFISAKIFSTQPFTSVCFVGETASAAPRRRSIIM